MDIKTNTNDENDISNIHKDVKKSKKMKGVEILNKIKSNIDENTEYTFDDIKKILSNIYKKPVKKSSVVKREPSAYNIFMKEEITKLRQDNPNTEYKDLMKLVADKWNEQKRTQ
jgi:galactokinase/mevalonate kinase-like predicted kinase